MSKLYPSPFLIGQQHDARQLKRLKRTHSEFDEKFLQELLIKHTALLPATAMRDDVGELLCIGREVTAGQSGSIDNLYLSTGGYPVIVETKLWRNPQARREVLAQVLDYVKEIVGKDYEWFDRQWQSFAKDRFNDSSSLLERLNSVSDDELDEQTFIDRVNRALERGDVLAMIVGDGIETRLQELVAHVSRDSAHLRYSLALVEIACYHLREGNDNNEMLVVPRIVREVEPIERAYVRIEMAEELGTKLHVTSVLEDNSKTEVRGKRRVILSEEEFLHVLEEFAGSNIRARIESFYNDLIDSFRLEPDFKSASLMLKVPDPAGEKASISVIGLERQGRIYNTTHMKSQLTRWGMPKERVKEICTAYWSELNKIDNGFSGNGIAHMRPSAFLPLKQVVDKFDRIKKAIGKVVKVIRDEVNGEL